MISRIPSLACYRTIRMLVELAITAVTNPFHLLQNTVGQNAVAAADNNDQLQVNSISVGGLGSDAYAGWIFWDAEVWMAPGLVVTYPDAAKQIAQYRVEKFAQARKNIQNCLSIEPKRHTILIKWRSVPLGIRALW